MDWSKAAQIATTAQAVFVIPALFIAGLQYFLQSQSEQDRKREAVINVMKSVIHPQHIDEAFGQLFNPAKSEVLKMNNREFDDKINSLSNYFWVAAACASWDLCDKKLILEKMCYDFLSFRYAYQKTHSDPAYNFDDTHYAVFRECPDSHHFKGFDNPPTPPSGRAPG
ncbi:MAG TPA: hypothetical protein VF601_15330 [Beijerinckiaceae bacterium]